MGFLSHKKPIAELRRLPTGSFTVDAQGRIVSSTVPQSVPAALVRDIGQTVVSIFLGARQANMSFSEIFVQYASFKITAREMRGGAIIFFSHKAPQVVSTP